LKRSNNSILITAVGGDIGQSAISSLLATEYGEKICGCDLDRYAAGRALLKRFKVAPPVSAEKEYEKFMLKLIKEWRLGYIVPLNEKEIEYFSRETGRYEELGVKVLVLDRRLVSRFLDKYETVKFLKANGFKTPRTFRPEEYQGELEFPLVLKARRSCGGKGLRVVNDKAELEFYLERESGLIIQEQVGDRDREYTVAVFSDGENTHSIAFQRYLGYGSMTRFARLVNDKGTADLARKLARACGLRGSLNVQLRKTSRGLMVFEINPRLSSTVHFRHEFGFTDLKWWLDLCRGKKIVYRQKYRSGVAVRTVGDVLFDLERIN